MDLNGTAAPQAVSSFSFLSKQNYYNDSPCHRLTGDAQGIWVLQCGDPTGTGSGAGPGLPLRRRERPGERRLPARHRGAGPPVRRPEQQPRPVLHRLQGHDAAEERRRQRLHDVRHGDRRAWTSSTRSRPPGSTPATRPRPSPRSASSASTSSRRPDADDRRDSPSRARDALAADSAVHHRARDPSLGPPRPRPRPRPRRPRRLRGRRVAEAAAASPSAAEAPAPVSPKQCPRSRETRVRRSRRPATPTAARAAVASPKRAPSLPRNPGRGT